MSFQQIQKQPITSSKETKKEKDNIVKNYHLLNKYNSKNQDDNQNYLSSNDNTIVFNFSDINIFTTDKNIRRKPMCTCGGNTCPKYKNKENITKIPNIQAKLKVSQPNDPLEREAEEVADQIMRMNLSKHNKEIDDIDTKSESDNEDIQINRKCTNCEEEDEEMTNQRK